MNAPGLDPYQRLFASRSPRGRLDRASLPSPVRYLSERGLLNAQRKPRGAWASIRCPVHKGGDERNPSMRVSLVDGHFRCIACGVKGGDIVALHRLLSGLVSLTPCASSEGASMVSASDTPKAAARKLAAGAIAQGFEPEALHEYRTAEGVPIYWRIRAKRADGEKWLRPMMVNGHGYELREPDFPAGKKPLYNLDRIAADTSAVVWIVEGEKAADALTKIGAVATTSGGAGSADDADWTPLTGRDCRIWPDNDDAGGKYAVQVVGILRSLGCRVSGVDVPKLGLPSKGDVVEWLQSHENASLSALKTLPLLQPAVQNTVMTDPDGPRVTLIRARDVVPEAIVWLWKDWIARGKLHILAGPPGTGKTTLTLALAATVTNGGRWPDGSRATAGDVVIWSGEDGISDTLLPRLLAKAQTGIACNS